MRDWKPPKHWPWVDTVGVALTVLLFLVPPARMQWLLCVVLALYFYSAFWGLVETHQRGLLGKRISQIYGAVQQSPKRSRFEHAAFMVAGAVLLVKYLF